MATKNKIGLQFKGFEEVVTKLEKLKGDIPKTTEEALVESKKIVAKNLVSATHKADYPAQGKYSAGLTRHSIDTQKEIEWEGTIASIPVGFNFDVSGARTIFLMYGTPRMPKAQKIYDAIWGSKIKKEIAKKQREIFEEKIKERLG